MTELGCNLQNKLNQSQNIKISKSTLTLKYQETLGYISSNFCGLFRKHQLNEICIFYFQPSPMMSNSPHQSLSSGSNPPTPPTRRHSLRGNGGGAGGNGSSSHTGETFESRFSNLFKSPQYLPPPEPFTQCAKTYPSRSQQQCRSN